MAAGVANRKAVVLEPAIDTVRTPESPHHLVWSACGDRLPVDLHDAGKVLRVNGVDRPPFLQLFQRHPGIVEDLPVEELETALCVQQSEQAGDVVNDQPG